MKIFILISRLVYGGAERQQIVLAKGLHQRGHEVVVGVFYAGGTWEVELQQAGIRVRSLGKTGRWDVFGFLWRLVQIVRQEHPDILYGFHGIPNVVTVIPKFFLPGLRTVWPISCAYMDLDRYDWVSRIGAVFSSWVSHSADALIPNSHAGLRYHQTMGYPAEKMIVIRNGIDTERYQPDPAARARIRMEWGIEAHIKLIGLVARLDPMKDHPVFFKAAQSLIALRSDVCFVCVGDGSPDYTAELRALADQCRLSDHVIWAGARDDMPAVYSALDLAVNSSYGEGLPNAVAEAMACDVPCVVTDVGDSAWLVGKTGGVVPPKQPETLMRAMEMLLNQPQYQPGSIRHRIVEHLSVNSLVTKTEHVLDTLLTGSRLVEHGSEENRRCVERMPR